MILKTKKCVKHAPFRTAALLLFAAVISAIVCGLHASNAAYLCEQEEACRTIPVYVTVEEVVGEDGIKSSLSSWTIDLFTGNNPVEIQDMSSENREIIQISLSDYLKDVRIKKSWIISMINGLPAHDQTKGESPSLIGITSLPSDERLLYENGCEITWFEGYDESVFGGEELVCLVPEGKVEDYDNGNGAAELFFLYRKSRMEGDTRVEILRREYNCTLKIVGTYTAGDEINIYCPFLIMEQVCSELEIRPNPDSISATLADNLLLDEFREKASFFYSNLSENAQNVSDGIRVLNRSKTYTFDNARNVLAIDDSKLIDFMSDLEAHSTKFNRIVTLAIFAVSVAAGCLIGFLMIRLRKREIMLMRVVGESNARVYVGFVLEQMMCIILGVIVGGAYYMWKPMDNLSLFVLTYFVGLSIALVIFMSQKLIKNIKEDE